jgi:hypothetical protein
MQCLGMGKRIQPGKCAINPKKKSSKHARLEQFNSQQTVMQRAGFGLVNRLGHSATTVGI